MRIAGRLEGCAFVPRREPVAAALAALRSDLVASLRARLDVRTLMTINKTKIKPARLTVQLLASLRARRGRVLMCTLVRCPVC